MSSRTICCTTPAFEMVELPEPTVVVVHDAGAANLILAWLEASSPSTCRAVMEGPGATLAARSFIPFERYSSLAHALDGAKAVLTGTGWASDLEHQARALARAQGVRSIAVLDHWVNYCERFVRAGVTVLPDELWVVDEYALTEARHCFPHMEIRLQPNLYFEKILQRVRPTDDPHAVLYLLEPARNDWGCNEPGEFQALDYFLQNMALAGLPAGTPVRLRPHPSDPPGKYDAWIAQHTQTSLDVSPDLAAAINRASWVAGCESAALTIALAAGRRVICTLPPWAPKCRLPHHGLIHLRQLASPSR